MVETADIPDHRTQYQGVLQKQKRRAFALLYMVYVVLWIREAGAGAGFP